MIEQITLPGNINILINAISAKFNDDTESNSKLRLYERELTATNKSLNNIIAAIENGIYPNDKTATWGAWAYEA